MGPLHQRAPGIIGAALDPRVPLTPTLIADLVHVHRALVATVLARRTPDPRERRGRDRRPVLRHRGRRRRRCRVPARTARSPGAVSLLDTAVRNVVGLGVPRTAALVAASIRPAAVLGLARAARDVGARRRPVRGGGLPRRPDGLPSGVVTRYAAAMSEHPVAAHAVGEIAGQILEQLEGEAADLVVLFVSPHFAGTTEDVVGVLRAVLAPRALVGATHGRRRRWRPGGGGHAGDLGVGGERRGPRPAGGAPRRRARRARRCRPGRVADAGRPGAAGRGRRRCCCSPTRSRSRSTASCGCSTRPGPALQVVGGHGVGGRRTRRQPARRRRRRDRPRRGRRAARARRAASMPSSRRAAGRSGSRTS